MALARDYRERFWEKVERRGDESCWLWMGFRDPNGYGRLSVKNIPVLVHRISYELKFGHSPGNLCVCHRCDNPRYVNPNHLFLGTRKDDLDDIHAKGRGRNGVVRGDNHWTRRNPRAVAGEKNGCAKLTVNIVKKIRDKYSIGGITQRQLAAMYGVKQSTIWKVIHGRNWS